MTDEEMTEEYIEQLKSALQECEKENENRATYTCEVIVSKVCKDAKNCIVELEKELKRVKEDNKLLETRGSDADALILSIPAPLQVFTRRYSGFPVSTSVTTEYALPSYFSYVS